MREAIRDGHGRILAYLHTESSGEIRVTDEHNKLLGRVKDSGTFDEHNRRVSYQREAGLLIQR